MLERALGIDRATRRPDPIYDDAREHLYERTVLEALARPASSTSWRSRGARVAQRSRRATAPRTG